MKAFGFAIGLMLALPAWSQSSWLVTPEEAQAARDAGDIIIVARSTLPQGAPRIEVVAPDLSRPVQVPARIEVRFTGGGSSEARPETFKALYGAFRLDITQRLLKFAKVTKEGIVVSEAELPSGRHQLLLTMTDTQGRQIQQTVSFTVQ
ncbi:MAG: hypothetical protein FJY42_12720 [Betaproteobacteria bacterium]|nr:hypothetical protein [Betaproteobacteria bacterium]